MAVRFSTCAVALVVAALVALGSLAQAQDQPTRPASVVDRVITSSGFGPFENATQVDRTSPAIGQAGPGDLVVRVDEMEGGAITAVVLKPRQAPSTYQIPMPPAGQDPTAFLQSHLNIGRDQGAGTILFPANQTLRVQPATSGQFSLTLNGFEDVVVDLNGSTVDFQPISKGLRIEDSRRVTIRNGRLRHPDVVLATIATIVPDNSAAGFKYEVLPEYRNRLEATTGGSPDLHTVGAAELGPDGWRVQTTAYTEAFINRNDSSRFEYRNGSFVSTSRYEVPDYPLPMGASVWLLHQNNASNSILLHNELGGGNHDITLESLDIINTPGMAILGEAVRGIHVNGVRILENPDDPLAFFASSSDAIHFNGSGGDIVVEDSLIEKNADDKVTSKGNYWRVQKVDNKTLRVVPVENDHSVRSWGRPGNSILFVDDNFGVVGRASLTASVKPRSTGTIHDITLNQVPNGIGVGSLVGNIDNSGPRMIVRNNTFEDTRAQGVKVQSPHIAVTQNSFTGIAGPAIEVALVLNNWYEGINTRNVLINGNTFDRSSRHLSKPRELISIRQMTRSGETVAVIDDIKIVGNTLLDPEVLVVDPAPAPALGSDPGPAARADNVELRYENKEPATLTDLVEVELELYNRDSQTRNLGNVEFRYNFTPDGNDATVAVTRTNVTEAAVTATYNEAGGYIAARIVGDQAVGPNKRVKVRFEVQANGGQFDQSNDPSFNNPSNIGLVFLDDAPAEQPTPVPATPIPATPISATPIPATPIPATPVPATPVPATPEPTVPAATPVPATPVAPTPVPPTPVSPTPVPATPVPPTPVPATPVPPTPAPLPQLLELVYENKESRSTTAVIEAELELYNRESVPLNLKGVELRYRYTDDGLTTEAKLTRTNALVGGFDIRNETENGYLAIRLVEDFTVQPSKRLKVRFEISAVGGLFDQANDPSFESPENIDVLWTGDVAYSVSLASFSSASANLTASAPDFAAAATAPMALAFDASVGPAPTTISAGPGPASSSTDAGFLRSVWRPATSG